MEKWPGNSLKKMTNNIAHIAQKYSYDISLGPESQFWKLVKLGDLNSDIGPSRYASQFKKISLYFLNTFAYKSCEGELLLRKELVLY